MKFLSSKKSKKSLAVLLIISALTLLSLSIAIGLDLSAITTKTASGLVTDYLLEHLHVDNDYIVVGSGSDGYSYIRTSDVNNPKGKVYNYRGRDSSNAIYQVGLRGFTKRNSDGKIYALYGSDIVDVINRQIVYSDTSNYNPNGFNGGKEKFLTDSAGNFWIGALNLDQAGNPTGENGLYKISADFSGKTTLLSDPIWSLFKDSGGIIWIVSNKGIYKRVEGGSPTLVFNSESSSPVRWAEQVIEDSGEIYAVMKNYFHYPYGTATKFIELYRWNGTTFVKVCDVKSESGIVPPSAQAFVYSGSLYIKFFGFSGTYVFNKVSGNVSLGSDIGSDMGNARMIAIGNALVSVGNVSGISLYNWNADGQTLRITSANTAEGLIANNIHSLYFSQATNRLLIGPERAEGFNVVVDNTFNIYGFPNTEVNTVGFFDYNGKLYVQGASNLYYLDAGQVVQVKNFATNGEKIYYDSRGYVWSFPNWGAGYGGIGVLDLESLTIKGTAGYWPTVDTWTLDQGYHFHDIISVPGENAVFIAVGDSEIIGHTAIKMPFVLKYNYTTNAFSKVVLPDDDCEGIRTFASDGTYLYGISRQRLYRYSNGTWEYYCPIQLEGGFNGATITEDYLFIISGGSGLEIVDLRTKTSNRYNSSVIVLPSDTVTAIAIQNTGAHSYRVWLGTSKGLAYCDLTNIRQ